MTSPLKIAAAAAVAATLTAAACAGKTSDRTSSGQAPRQETGAGLAGVSPGIVDAAQARRLVAAGVKVVDVRTPAEFEAGHLPGAVNLPHDRMAERAGELGAPSTPVLLYCRSGRRSAIAAEVLRARGFTELYDLQAYDRWVAAERGSAGR